MNGVAALALVWLTGASETLAAAMGDSEATAVAPERLSTSEDGTGASGTQQAGAPASPSPAAPAAPAASSPGATAAPAAPAGSSPVSPAAPAAPAGSSPVSPAAPAAPAASSPDLAGVVKTLRGLTIQELDVDVPAPAIPLLTTLKHGLRDEVIAQLGKAKGEVIPARLTQSVLEALKARGVQPSGGDETRRYGDFEVAVSKIGGHPDLLAATVTLALSCDSDSALYLFRRDKTTGWTLVTALESNGYSQISGGLGGFGFQVSPKAPDGSWFIVATNTKPWCTSNWNSIQYQVLRPGTDPYEPRTLLKREETLFAYESRLNVQATGFKLSFEGGVIIYTDADMSAVSRGHTVNYKVAGDTVTRHSPIATDARGFVDEWVSLPWEEAVRWTDARVAPQLQTWHDRLNRALVESQGKVSAHFAKVKRCNTPAGWMLHTRLSVEGDVPDAPPENVYFRVVGKGTSLKVDAVSGEKAPSCK